MFLNTYQSRASRRGAGYGFFICAFLLCIVYMEYVRLTEPPWEFGMIPELRHVIESPHNPHTKALIIAKMRKDDVRWLINLCTSDDFKPYIYSMEDTPEDGFLIPRSNRGRETASYLSYIIDFYDSLPEYSIFVHSNHEQWHNDLFGPKTADTLKQLRVESVKAKGYVNLRCKHDPGCPVGINPFSPTETDIHNKDPRAFFADFYMQIFEVPREEVPEHIGNVCCGQFAVSRDRILARPKGDYERMLKWADDSRDIIDNFAVGWVFEKIWHIIFGMDPTYCPRYEQCRCDNYGWCGPLSSGEILRVAM